MNYDLIVVGGGPGGLMAALTAAQDGMRVLLLERKKAIGDISRACLQILYVKPFSPLAGGKTYMEPVTVKMGASSAFLINQNIGFTIEYRGQLRPYLNWLQISPRGNVINRFKVNESPWGFYYQKDVFCRELFDKAVLAGVTVRLEAIAEHAENTSSGVRITVKSDSGHEVLKARNAVIADGVQSHIADSIGFDRERRVLAEGMGGVSYILDGIESPFPSCSLLSFSIPSLDPKMNIIIGQMADNMNSLGGLSVNWEEIRAHPTFAPMFRKARLVQKRAWAANIRTPIRSPVSGNCVVVGDAAAPTETWIMGAVACGYQAVKAINKERNGEKGFTDYIRWWQGAFAFNQPDYFSIVSNYYGFNRVCNDEDIDFLYDLFKDRIGIPGPIIASNMELIAEVNPGLHRKLLQALETSMWQKR